MLIGYLWLFVTFFVFSLNLRGGTNPDMFVTVTLVFTIETSTPIVDDPTYSAVVASTLTKFLMDLFFYLEGLG